jgi:hypothetical protein
LTGDEYTYASCAQKDKLCDRNKYNVSQEQYDIWSGTSIYESCDEFTGVNRNPPQKDEYECTFQRYVYHLIGCKEGYHSENGKWCIPNVDVKHCKTINLNKPEHSHWLREAGYVDHPWISILGTKYVDQ